MAVSEFQPRPPNHSGRHRQRPPQGGEARWARAVVGLVLCAATRTQFGRDTPSPSRAPSVAEWGFLVGPTLVLRPLHLHLMFGGGLVPLSMPNHGFRRLNVSLAPVIPNSRHGNCCLIQGQTTPIIGRPGMHARAGHLCGRAGHTAQASVHAGRTHAPPCMRRSNAC